jgi:(p)ppGpp synthase/HD superfamily hydrolase
MTDDWIMVLRAADAAARWHVHQRRKGAAEEPYVNHLLEVATLVAHATAGADPRLVVAALLHDAIEDQEVPQDVIRNAFGADVLEIILEVTDDKSLPKDVRKALQIERAPHKSARAKILKLADLTSNLRALAASPPTDWSVQRRLEYVAWATAVGAGLAGVTPALEAEFHAAIAAARRATVFED